MEPVPEPDEIFERTREDGRKRLVPFGTLTRAGQAHEPSRRQEPGPT